MDAPLLLCFPFVREPVLRLLTLVDAVTLLALCRVLRDDSDAVAFVLRTIPVTRHFGHGCRRDWLLVEPRFDYDYMCYNDQEAPLRRGQNVVSASLLSFVGLLQSTLGPVWYEEIRRYGRSSYCVPFTLPVRVNRDSSCEELRAVLNVLSESQRIRDNHNRPALGSMLFPEDDDGQSPVVSSPGLHWENLEFAHTSEHSIVCRFCEGMEHEICRIREEATRVCIHGDRVSDELRDAGYTEALIRALADRYQGVGIEDAIYVGIQSAIPQDDIAFNLFAAGCLQLLERMGPRTEMTAMCVGEATGEEYVTELCPEVYRPLRQIFSTNNFRHVRRIQTTLYTQADALPMISSVEMIGGLSPHGYYAGVFLVQVNPW